jgi:2'-5' RNA ligase
MKRDSLKLYFVAIVPKDPVYSEVLKFKTEIKESFGSSAALRSPPHITLHMPFQWKEEKEGQLIDSLDQHASIHQPIKVQLNNFGAFTPRVIYVHVNASDSLNMLQKEISRNASIYWHIYPKPNSRPFVPHMTIAFRDLKKPKFFEAWKEFEHRKYNAEFSVSDICLLKHNGKTWDIYHRANLATA